MALVTGQQLRRKIVLLGAFFELKTLAGPGGSCPAHVPSAIAAREEGIMRFRTRFVTVAGLPLLLSAPPAFAQMSDEDMIQNAMSAAPEAVAKDATIIAMDDQMQMRTLREGTNNFTCMPDNPASRATIRCASTRPPWAGRTPG